MSNPYLAVPDGAKAALAPSSIEERLVAALRIFLGEDERFAVAVAGNPFAVDRMLAEQRALLVEASVIWGCKP